MLKWRSIERGMVENELILRKYIEKELPRMDEEKLKLYSDFLDEIDPEMYLWISGRQPYPEKYLTLGAEISEIVKNYHSSLKE